MSVQELTPKRVFVFKNERIQDPDFNLHPYQVIELLSYQYPELVNAKTPEPDLSDDGTELVYTIQTSVGQHG